MAVDVIQESGSITRALPGVQSSFVEKWNGTASIGGSGSGGGGSSGGGSGGSAKNIVSLLKRLPTSTVNIILQLPGLYSTFTKKELIILRSLAIAGSCMSIILVSISMYFYFSMDKRRTVFRHQFIFYLLVCDLMKAIALLAYPVVILLRNELYGTPSLYNTIGFFTQFATEGADIAIFFFALHFALLVFRPKKRYLNKRTGNIEGGLYNVRYTMYLITLILPLVMASLAFIDFNKENLTVIKANSDIVTNNLNYAFQNVSKTGGYKPLSTYCALPPWPLWYSLVLSWGPRYAIIVSIIGIYIAIYIHVIKESTQIKNQLKNFNDPLKNINYMQQGTYDENKVYKGTNLIKRFFYFIKVIPLLKRIVKFLEFDIEENDETSSNNNESATTRSIRRRASTTLQAHFKHHKNRLKKIVTTTKRKSNATSSLFAPTISNSHDLEYNSEQADASVAQLKTAFNHDVYNQFKQRRIAIKRQVKSIFLYPIAYLICWFIPMVESFTQISYEERHGPVLGISYISVFLHPFNGFADSCVFLIREKPWRFYWKIIETEELISNHSSPTYISEEKQDQQPKQLPTKVQEAPAIFVESDMLGSSADHATHNNNNNSNNNNNNNNISSSNNSCSPQKPGSASSESLSLSSSSLHHERNMLLRYGISEESKWGLMNTELGKRGWYYKGIIRKKHCWRHQPQLYKKIVWLMYRIFDALLHIRMINLRDNCNDSAHWTNHYQLSEKEQSFHEFDEFYQKVPWYWKLYHFLPLKEGIDLDEVDLSIKLKMQENMRKNNDFNKIDLPDLNIFLTSTDNDISQSNSIINDDGQSIFKDNYNMAATNDVIGNSNNNNNNNKNNNEENDKNNKIRNKKEWYKKQEELQKIHECELKKWQTVHIENSNNDSSNKIVKQDSSLSNNPPETKLPDLGTDFKEFDDTDGVSIDLKGFLNR